SQAAATANRPPTLNEVHRGFPGSWKIMSRLSEAVPSSRSITGLSIGGYLIRRLQDYGVRHVFGIPGDYVLTFYKMLSESPIQTVNCTREDCAGFAADAYARVNGMGAVCV